MKLNKPFINKYRPTTFDQVVGQDYPVKFLSSSIQLNYYSNGWLIYGPHGLGKTTLARIYAKAILCDNLVDGYNPCNSCESCKGIDNGTNKNYFEQDSASNRKVKDIDDLFTFCSTLPFDNKKIKVVVLDECHALTREAEDKLLKPLEEGISQVLFLMLTTDFEAVKPTTKSRLQFVEVKKCPIDIIISRLKYICEEEELSYDERALYLIADKSGGHIRDAVKYLNQMAMLGDISYKQISDYFLNDSSLDLIRMLNFIPDNIERSIDLLHSISRTMSNDDIYEAILRTFMKAMKSSFNTLDSYSVEEVDLLSDLNSKYGSKILFCSDHIAGLKKFSINDIAIFESSFFVLNSYINGKVVSPSDISSHVELGSNPVRAKISSQEYKNVRDNINNDGALLTVEEFAKRLGCEIK